MNAAIIALDAGSASKDGTWPQTQALMRAVAKQQWRTARLLLHPDLPWPVSIRDLVVVPAEFILRSSGAMEAMAVAPTLEAYELLMTDFRARITAREVAEQKAEQKANTVIKSRLGIEEANCPNQ
jgi:hypothetical protein